MRISKYYWCIPAVLLLACTAWVAKGPMLKKQVHEKVIGLTPPDMVFIPGNDKMRSFWMSASEEPNMNYVIYLNWLKQVYGSDFPDLYAAALPNNEHPEISFTANDPYLNAYMTHPAYSYYPVTGLTWLQIQDYLMWKTDRFNEYNLVRYGILFPNPSQVGSDSYNSEAYLVQQYEGAAGRWPMKDVNPNGTGTRHANFSDGIFVAAYRLPTEQEWEYAADARFEMPFDMKSKTKRQADSPYGDSYYLKAWIDIMGFNVYGNVSDKETGDYNKYRTTATNPSNLPQRQSSISDYDWDYYGVANMSGNVREWTANFYTPAYDDTETDTRKVYLANGFSEYPTPSYNMQFSHYNYEEKDSLGKMPFIAFGVDGRGDFDKLTRYHPQGNYKSRVVRGGTWQKPDSKARTAMKENTAAGDVGFRCAMNYTGIPFSGWRVANNPGGRRSAKFYRP